MEKKQKLTKEQLSEIRRAAARKSAEVRHKGDLSVIRIFTADAEKVRALASARNLTAAEILREALTHLT